MRISSLNTSLALTYKKVEKFNHQKLPPIGRYKKHVFKLFSKKKNLEINDDEQTDLRPAIMSSSAIFTQFFILFF